MNTATPLHTVKTTCPYCGVGCGIDARVEGGPAGPRLIAVSGSQVHPTNQGRLCVKGSNLHETVDHHGRLLHPQIEGNSVSWDTALDHVAERFSAIIAEHGPDAVAFYLSGQLLTEDYYVANKLMKGYIGSGNVDTNSRLCMSSAVSAHKRAFGADIVPGCYEDLELADLLILVGSNAAWAHPIVYQRIAAAKQQRPDMQIVVIDPRRTATCDIADLHLPLKPGSDAHLFNGLLAYLAQHDGLDQAYIDAHTEDFDAALQQARSTAPSLLDTAAQCELAPADLQRLFELFCTTPRCVTLFSQGINQSSTGVDKANAIINCHLASGKIGKPGATPFSITGQPNAMGGREVGGLANQLAAHMDITNPVHRERLSRFWQAPNLTDKEGLKALDMFQAVHDGQIKAIWIIGTNPVDSMPDSNYIRAALQRCELVVVSDCTAHTDTTACANVLLPATTWGEKDGTTTNSERRISRQTGFLPSPGEARHDWQIICALACKLGYGDAFAFQNAADIFREHAALSGFENDGERLFDISALSSLSNPEYAQLAPVQWPVSAARPTGSHRLFTDGRYPTASGRARFIPITPAYPYYATNSDYPLVLNTGRIRDQWHTMTRTAKALTLLNHTDAPFAELHPDDAAALQIVQDALVELRSPLGRCIVRAQLTDAQRPGSVFMPIHWNDQFAAHARVDSLIHPVMDSLSGQPESKHTPVKALPLRVLWQGVLHSRSELKTIPCAYWVKTPTAYGYRYELADTRRPDNWEAWLSGFIEAGNALDEASGIKASQETIQLNSSSGEQFRMATFNAGILEWLFMAGPERIQPNHNWLAEQFSGGVLDSGQRQGLLSGRAVDPGEDCGAIICACFQVGEKTINSAIEAGCNSAESLAEQLNCGSNCGSCIPEIKALIKNAG